MVTSIATAFDPQTAIAAASQDGAAVDASDSSNSGSDAGVAGDDVDLLTAETEVKQTRQGRDWRPKSTLHLRLKRGEPITIWERAVKGSIMPDEYHELKPDSLDRGPLQTHSMLSDQLFILGHAAPPMILQQLSYMYYPEFKWPAPAAYLVYVLAFAIFLVNIAKRCAKYALMYGTFDEKNIGRDRTPDAAIPQLAKGFLAYIFVRPLGEFLLSWDQNQAPLESFRWTTPLRFAAHLMLFDYFFYVYHRSCHEVPWLWKIHSKHHTTKHPSPALGILADEWQELIEIVLCPLFAALLVPMHFHELYLLGLYAAYVEVWGHSGIRVINCLPVLGVPLRLIGMELLTEDHDLHHRYGKSGRNYGKQSRFWDVLFDTTTPREEFANLPGHRPY